MTLLVSKTQDMSQALDIVPFIAFGGIKWSRNDINGTSAGRTLDGVMHINRIGTKIRLDITFKQLTSGEMSQILNLLNGNVNSDDDELNGYVWVTYDDPMYGRRNSIKMYSNNIPAQIWMSKNNTWMWDKFTAPLIEV